MFTSPFLALNAQASGLELTPPSLEPLQKRMASLYGVDGSQLAVTRGASHALEILLRRQKVNGFDSIYCRQSYSEREDYLQALSEAYGLMLKPVSDCMPPIKGNGLFIIDNPKLNDGKPWDLIEARTLAVELFPTLLVIDESYFDVCQAQSLSELTKTESNVVVLKSLSFLYGLAGARVGALIAGPKTLLGLSRFIEPKPLSTPSIRAAEAALSPSRSLSVKSRVDLIRSELIRVKDHLSSSPEVKTFSLNEGPFVFIVPNELGNSLKRLKTYGLTAYNAFDGLILPLGDKAQNDRLLAALGVSEAIKPTRRAEVLRDTKETKISALIDLDVAKPVTVSTGIGFFDHMLDQVATHGGFSLQLACEGDLEIDAHHTIEDCMLCFGAALKASLGDRIGMARFGFVLPMDETEAKVSIDISGRAFCVFKGEFVASHIGEFPTEMTGHAFRSLSEALGASIHVEVTGENDHHKVEACFKALGRALRMATRLEGNALPSTKGMLA
jgi:imidazoleglycerol-phosphate dehydratase / histidinol-phosphatase